MTEAQFVKFTEVNDWEGETWHFWLPVEGNEVQLVRLAVVTRDEECEYSLDMKNPLNEAAVDILVANADDTDYMAEHTKVAGILRLPEELDEHLGEFYKGGIVQLFTAAKRIASA